MQPSTPSICPTCKSSIASDAPGGLCPACTLEKAATVAHTATGGHRSAPPAIAEIATHFPDLEILELIGAGGMGAVYKARQPQLDRTVALKILSHDLAHDPAFVERFNREAKVLARLSHPNIVGVFDFGTAGPYCYLLMEHVDGVNLRQAMRTGGFKPSETLALIQEVCAALQFAHDEGILHRDIKPENILIDSKGRVKIADFGIAKLVGENHRHDVTLTLQGSILGSPQYMAPEQIETPGDVDQRADIYSLGVVLYEMLTGELPIGRFALPSEKAMDARIDEIVLRTLAKEREARFQTAQEVSTQVDAMNQSPPPVSYPSTPAGLESGMARFSVLSAILTAVSIIFGIIVAYLFSSFGNLDHVIRKIGAGWALFDMVVTFGTAVTGFILGASALGSIRKSGGRKSGAGFAIFAVTTWPILFMGIMELLSLRVRMLGDTIISISFPLALLLIATMLLLGSFVLIRGLHRWTCGVENEDGQKHFPRLSGTLLVTLGLAILGPVLAAVLPLLLGPSHDSFRHSQTMMRGETLAGDDSEPRGKKMTLEVSIDAGKILRFQVYRVDADGLVKPLDIKGAIPTSDGRSLHTSLEIISTEAWKESTRQELTASFQIDGGKTYSRSVFLDEEWEFNTSGKGSWLLEEDDKQKVELATRRDWKGKKLETLYLEIEPQNQP